MTDLRTAAQQALEALGHIQRCIGFSTATIHYDSSAWQQSYDAVDALRAALEQPAEPVAWRYQNANTDHVYLVWEKGNGGRNWTPLYTTPPDASARIAELEQRLSDARSEGTALRVNEQNLAERQWVGLTDADRASVQYEAHKKGLTPLEFMELHEAKLRERNGGKV